jgi:hypothetical protein
MLKYFFALTLLTNIVLCRFTLDERQWAEGDAREHCITTCHDDCEYCEEPTHCTVTEDKCGEEPPKVHPNCSPDEVCVPAGCDCRSDGTDGEPCALICPCDCMETEKCCPGGVETNGCKENDFCHDKGMGSDGSICPGFCPFTCEETKLTCPEPDDPVTGCDNPASCIPKQNDNNGDECLDQQCPLTCHITYRLCIGDVQVDGCKEDDICIPKGTGNNDQLCAGNCPVECVPEEIKCPGQEDYCTDCPTSGCFYDDECKPRAKDMNGESCVDESASHECPVTCPEDEYLCPPATTPLGCLEQEICHPKTKDEDGDWCDPHSYCPTLCQPHEVLCEVNDLDEWECKLPDLCIQQNRDFDGELCPVHCPIECPPDELLCPGQINENGCVDPDVCVKRETKTEGSDKGGLCPGWCPPICRHGELRCPSQVDPCDGCPTEEICVEAALDLNNVFCSGITPDEPLSASHGCTKLCDDLKGEVLCPEFKLPNGCKAASICMARSLDDNDQYCPSHSVCPTNCGADEKVCAFDVDSRGCQSETICVTRGIDGNGDLCEGWCPPNCGAETILKSNGEDGKGCSLPSTCVAP